MDFIRIRERLGKAGERTGQMYATVRNRFSRRPSYREIAEGVRSCGKQLVEKVKNGYSAFLRREYSRRDFVILFLIGISIGIIGKTISSDRVTVGYQDYTLSNSVGMYNLNAVERVVMEKASAASTAAPLDPTVGGSCTE